MGEYELLQAFDEEDEARDTAKPQKERRSHLAEALIAIALALFLAIVPLVAHAETEGEDASAQSTATSSAQQESAGDDARPSDESTPSKRRSDALTASGKKTICVRGKTLKTKDAGARGIVASGKATIVAGGMKVSTTGEGSPAIVAEDEGASVSIVSSSVKTSRANSALIFSSGTIEAEDISGRANSSAIAELSGNARVLVSNSSLSSQFTGVSDDKSLVKGITEAVSNTADNPGAIVMAHTSDADDAADNPSSGKADAATAAASDMLFQATGSTLSSSLQAGSLFRIIGAQAKIVLSNVELEYDSDAAALLSATAAESGASQKTGGASVTFTCYEQRMAGTIESDASSSIDCYLLQGSSWTGEARPAKTSSASTASNHLNVSIDSTSSWIVSGDSTVTNLNLESGGKLIDTNGDAVKIVDADGNSIVDGTSDIEVKVIESFTTAISTMGANKPEMATISRTGYDEKFDTSTTFGENGKPTSPSAEDEARELAAYITQWFKNLQEKREPQA